MNIQIVFNNINTFPRIIDIDTGLEIKDIISYQIKNKVMTSTNGIPPNIPAIYSKYPTEITLTIKCDKINIEHEFIEKVEDNKVVKIIENKKHVNKKDKIVKQKDKLVNKKEESNFDNLILD